MEHSLRKAERMLEDNAAKINACCGERDKCTECRETDTTRGVASRNCDYAKEILQEMKQYPEDPCWREIEQRHWASRDFLYELHQCCKPTIIIYKKK